MHATDTFARGYRWGRGCIRRADSGFMGRKPNSFQAISSQHSSWFASSKAGTSGARGSISELEACTATEAWIAASTTSVASLRIGCSADLWVGHYATSCRCKSQRGHSFDFS